MWGEKSALGIGVGVIALLGAVWGDAAGGQSFRELSGGEMAEGVLGEGGEVGIWRFGGVAGEIVTVEAGSVEFDVVVELWRVGGGRLGRDDDGGRGTDAALMAVLPATGQYEVRVVGFGGGGGRYRVGVRSAEVVDVELGRGRGLLDAGTMAEGWRFAGGAGEVVEVRAMSAAFDTVLELQTAGGEEVGWDDDGGGGTDSRLVATLPESGDYVAWIGAFGGAGGVYEVVVERRRPAPTADAGVWAFRGGSGERVEVIAGSRIFDTVVELGSVGGEELGWDDDGGPGTDSRLMARLPRDGEYRVVVSGADGRGGPYDVAVRRLEARTLELGAVVEGVLGEDGGVWRFRGEGGRTVVVSVGSDAFDAVVELRSVGGDEVGSDDDGGPGSDSRMVATLPGDGDYEVLVGALSGRDGGYTVMVEEAEAVFREVGSLEVGGVGDGVLGVDSGVWRFRGEVGQTVVVSAGSDAFDTVLELWPVGGRELGRDDDGGAGTDSRLIATLPADGEYEILVKAFSDGGGSYSVSVEQAERGFLDVASSAIGSLEIGASVDGVLGADGGVWRFWGEAGKTVVVSAGSDAFDTVVELWSADGEEVGRDDDGGFGSDSRLLATLPSDGEYEVVVTAFSEGDGRYTVAVEEVEVPAVEATTSQTSLEVTSVSVGSLEDGLTGAGSLEVGAAVDGSLGSDGGDLWRFRGEAGRVVVVSAGSDEFDTVVRLSSANGRELGWDDDGGSDADSRLVTVLPDDGEYEVVVTAFGGGGGRYTVAVRYARPVEVGAVVEGVLGVDDDVWGFRGEAGQTVLVEAASDAFDTVVELWSADGEEVGRDDDGGPGTDSRLVRTLSDDGYYEVRVRSVWRRGGYTLRVAVVEPGSVEVGGVVDGDLGVDGGIWRFTGRARQTVVVEAGSDAFDAVLELRSVEGGVLGWDDAVNSDARVVTSLPRDGEYEVGVTSSFDWEVGAYRLSVREADVGFLEMGAVVDGVVGVDGGMWRFRGEAGQTVVVETGADGSDTGVELWSMQGYGLGSGGDVVAGTGSRLVATLPREGGYEVRVNVDGAEGDRYTLGVHAVVVKRLEVDVAARGVLRSVGR